MILHSRVASLLRLLCFTLSAIALTLAVARHAAFAQNACYTIVNVSPYQVTVNFDWVTAPIAGEPERVPYVTLTAGARYPADTQMCFPPGSSTTASLGTAGVVWSRNPNAISIVIGNREGAIAPGVIQVVSGNPRHIAYAYEHFIAGDYIFSPKVYNEFSPGNSHQGASFSGRAAAEFPALGLRWMIEGDGRQYAYPHIGDFDTTVSRNAPCFPGAPQGGNRGCVTTIGSTSNVYVPSFDARDRDLDARLGLKVADPRIYIAAGYLWRNTNYGYPQQHGVGYAIEKLPDLDRPLSLFGSYWYSPNEKGNYTDPFGTSFNLAYRIQRYQAGFNYSPLFASNAGVFIEGGFQGDIGTNKTNAPIEFRHYGWFGGVGIKF
jgi:hypothetical protein